MYNGTFYIPGNYIPNMAVRGIGRNIIPMNQAIRAGLFERLGNAIKGIKSLNWGGLINNTSKTLGIINQTIPLVKQVGPMVGNMRSMLKIASIFKDETDPVTNKRPVKNHNQTNQNSNHITNNQKNNNSEQIEDYSPNFFIN